MELNYSLKKFTEKDLDNIEEIKLKILKEPSVFESIRYILTETYRFGDYVMKRITIKNKKGILVLFECELTDSNIHGMFNRLEGFRDELSLKETNYLESLIWLYNYQIAILKLYNTFPNVSSLKKPSQLPATHQKQELEKIELDSYQKYKRKPITREELIERIKEEEPLRLRTFKRYELQRELEPLAQEYDLVTGESVPMQTVRNITKRLIKEGWDAKESSVAEAFRKMSFVRGRRM